MTYSDRNAESTQPMQVCRANETTSDLPQHKHELALVSCMSLYDPSEDKTA